MFKKYHLSWNDTKEEDHDVDFYVQIRTRRKGGFSHRAIVVGDLPRIDSMKDNYARYNRHTKRMDRCRRAYAHTVPGGALVMEKWPGRHVLCKLWDKLSNLPFTDMQQIRQLNPFGTNYEPAHEDLVDAEELFKK